MAQATWEKPSSAALLNSQQRSSGRWKFMLGGLLILAAVVYLVISGTLTSARFFITVDELVNNPAYVGKTVQISGAVIGDTIQYDEKNGIIEFTIANIPTEFDDLAEALHQAVSDPAASQLHIVVENAVMPDLLKHEAQAILPGTLGEDGRFYATDLLLKCPSRFEEAGPENLSADHPQM
ncbi:MAG: cytochrome c maturation protein CcmE [Anaerolineae bacterium]|nr:cytochrome c maturation protein CcmE [Anaerolineae bacterium]